MSGPGPRLCKLLAFCANGGYGGYLAHTFTVPKLFLCVTPPIFILSILGGSLLQWLVGKFISFQKEAVP